ncbi:ABC transporter ATP-binding protein [Heyndrickxia coagulans]|uniref:ABC transporter ATP-binding protein n=2 Tax=Heyndrickxia coagulans TaxID=1398 RepID=UPI002E1E9C80|nr:ABC transporter ATP-binding protein [Heyndrickxia coagulans]MED4964127.1 ABC transporter ATP-binding protein [Heyndrickxia coagulans]
MNGSEKDMKRILIKNLTYGFENQPRLFDNVNIEIDQNSIVRLYGKNGSGKTTLLKIIANIIDDPQLSYELRFFCEKLSFADIRKRRVFVGDSPVFYEELTMEQNIQFYNLLFHYGPGFNKQVYGYCKKFDVYAYKHEPVKNLSLGTRQKIFLSINLSVPSELVLLDEPFNSLDTSSRKVLSEIITQSKQKTFIIVSHEKEASLSFTHELNSENWQLKRVNETNGGAGE